MSTTPERAPAPDGPTGLGAYPLEHGPRSGETIIFLHGGNMAAWTWDLQVRGLADRHVLTPDLPGYGARIDLVPTSFSQGAQAVARLIEERALDGRAHVVGLSMGGFIALHLLGRYPQLVRSCLVSGSALSGYSAKDWLPVVAQVPLWTRHWYWGLLATAFSIPLSERQLFASTGAAASPATNRSLVRLVRQDHLAGARLRYPGPVLAVAAEHDVASVSRAFGPLREHLPQLQTWTAPGVHHPWSSEAPDLFNEMVRTFVDTGSWSGPQKGQARP